VTPLQEEILQLLVSKRQYLLGEAHTEPPKREDLPGEARTDPNNLTTNPTSHAQLGLLLTEALFGSDCERDPTVLGATPAG
jgi:hypothetical protein